LPNKTYQLRLYVVGGQVGSQRAEPDLRQVLDACVPGEYVLEVIDLRARPDLAAADQVMAAPTVIRLEPQPVRRIVGSLADVQRVCSALQLPPPRNA
jgi:circadian clock protein KaiB